jgi:hypothetical protein
MHHKIRNSFERNRSIPRLNYVVREFVLAHYDSARFGLINTTGNPLQILSMRLNLCEPLSDQYVRDCVNCN